VRIELGDMPEGPERAAKIDAIKAEIEEGRQIVLKAGGLYVVGTERHESRRIDNQLRGRSGRQGDPGGSKFFLSLEDDLMRIFGSDRMDGMLTKLGLKEGEAIVHSWINAALEKAQKKVEARNFEIRKQLLKYDDVMNDQRKVVYEQRRDVMRQDDVADQVVDMRHETVEDLIARCIPHNAYPEQWDTSLLHEEIRRIFALDLPVVDWAKEEGIAEEEIRERISDAVERKMAEKAANVGPDIMRQVEKSLLLQELDHAWKEHLLTLDHLRQGINLRAYGQRDPLNEYKKEAFELFEAMLKEFRERITSLLALVQIRMDAPPQGDMLPPDPDTARMLAQHPSPDGMPGDAPAPSPTKAARAARVNADDPATWGATSRNAPCPCGSGKKYKHCHGKV